MPIYEYEHLTDACVYGKRFEVKQSLQEESLTHCPHCQGKVRKIISRISISCPRTNSEIRDLGFTKLVKRDDGVYENVTRRGSDSRYVVRGQSDTMPNFSHLD